MSIAAKLTPMVRFGTALGKLGNPKQKIQKIRKSDNLLKTIVNCKNKKTLSSPGRFGFLTEPE